MAKVLVADDEPEARRVLVDILTEAGHETEEAFDGLNALDRVVEFRPDILLLDWMIPELYGGEVLRKLRNDPQYADFVELKVIIVSDFRDDKSLHDFRAAGADELVSKMDDVVAMKKYLLPRIDKLLGGGE